MSDNKALSFVLVFTIGTFMVLTVMFVIWLVKSGITLWRNYDRNLER